MSGKGDLILVFRFKKMVNFCSQNQKNSLKTRKFKKQNIQNFSNTIFQGRLQNIIAQDAAPHQEAALTDASIMTG